MSRSWLELKQVVTDRISSLVAEIIVIVMPMSNNKGQLSENMDFINILSNNILIHF